MITFGIILIKAYGMSIFSDSMPNLQNLFYVRAADWYLDQASQEGGLKDDGGSAPHQAAHP